ncbi:MAG: hypothetical protein PVH18_10385 [Chloroflexota bacterium]|jgi:hypothetical protein
MSQLARVTKVKTLTATRRVRALARSGQIVVPVGQTVAPAQVVAHGPAASAYRIIPAGEILKAPPEKIKQYLLVKEGATLERGTPLLRKPRRFGRAKIYRSPLEGTLDYVRDGTLVLRRAGKVEEVRALLTGQVVSIIPDKGVIIESVGSLIQAVWDSGKSAVGRLMAPAGNAEDELTIEDLGPEASGAVCIAGYVTSAEALESLEERGARGLVAGSMPAELCLKARSLSYPVLLTEGVGRKTMAEPIFELLNRLEGREVSLLAESQIYRPQPAEIIIPLPTSGPLTQTEMKDSLQPGSLVRLLGLGDQTTLGRVAKMHARPRRTAHGGMAPGADVVLADGRAMFIPYANLDIIG